MARARRPLSSVRVTMHVAFDTTGLDRALDALDALTPEAVTQLLRQAVAETLLTAYRRRFLDNFEQVLTPELAHGGSSRPKTPTRERAKERVVEAYAALAAAEATGKAAAVRAAQRKLAAAEAKLVEHTEREFGGSPLSTGHFRELAVQVLRTLSESTLVNTHTGATGASLGIGRLADLEAVETPSATPLVAGHPTASSFTSMWRQVEFGTGVYSTLPGGARHKNGWWYGPRPGFGLKVLGAHGAHVVFDAATGLPYTQDAVRFEEVFAGLMGRALSGR